MSATDPGHLDLQTCDREPIHIPGSVQPHGVVLAIDPEAYVVLQAGGDAQRLLGRSTAALVNRSIDEALPDKASVLVRALRSRTLPEPLYVGSFSRPEDGQSIDVTAHERDQLLLLELEPASLPRESAAQLLGKVRAISAELQAAPDLQRLCESAARCVRLLTGFDRVMVYRFLEDETGCVFAEARQDALPPFLNHRYPASDIPKQARALYLRNLIRVIPDVAYAPAPLVPALCPATGQPLDMSDCSLRSVSPIHIQYLKNMGVSASMSVSIVRNGALWGLVACHHTAPKHVPYELREACKHVGQILAQQIRAREEADRYAEILRLGRARDEAIGSLATADDVEAALLEHCPALQGLIPADGAAVCCGDQLVRCGHTPAEGDIRVLADWLLETRLADPYATHALSEAYAPAASYPGLASGLLATVLSREERLVFLWFRAEQIETVNWAGNPHKPAEPAENPGVLTPRKSFELWRETVRGRSHSWSAAEVEAAASFRRAVLELRQQHRLRELNAQLRQILSEKEDLLAQKDLLMREVDHRVQNSLQIVSSMLSLQAREMEPSVRVHFDEARRRIMAVGMIHQRLWRSGQIRSVEFGTYLGELRDALVEVWGRTWARHLKVDAGPMLVPTDLAVVLALVITELLTNAVKYAYRGAPGPIELTVERHGLDAIRVTVADRGIGMPAEVSRSGLGSRLTASLIAQLGGDIEIAANSPGTRVSLTVPDCATQEGD